MHGFAEVSFEALASGDFEGSGVEAHEMEDGGVKVGDVVAAFDGVEAEFISSAVDVTSLGSASCHDDVESVRVMVAAVALQFSFSKLGAGGAAKFAAPDDECVVEHAAKLEVTDEGGDGLIDLVGEA